MIACDLDLSPRFQVQRMTFLPPFGAQTGLRMASSLNDPLLDPADYSKRAVPEQQSEEASNVGHEAVCVVHNVLLSEGL